MTAADVAAVPLSDLDHRAQLRRAVIASTVGTTIEWYDFLVYGQMAALVFGKLYFPKSDPLTGPGATKDGGPTGLRDCLDGPRTLALAVLRGLGGTHGNRRLDLFH